MPASRRTFLVFAAGKLKLDSDKHAALMNAFLELVPWPDVVPALDSLAKSGLRLAPRAYGLGTEALGLRREEILFVAHVGWDAAGAKSFGYPTFWVNRADLPPEELGAPPDAVGHDLPDLVRFIDQLGAGGGR